MIDKNGYEFEFAEKETGFVEEATAVFENSAELLIIGFNPEGERKSRCRHERGTGRYEDAVQHT